MEINYLEELEECGVNFDFQGGTEWLTVTCPFHADSSPSGGINTANGTFKCLSCGHSTDFINYLATLTGATRGTVTASLAKKYGYTETVLRTIEASVVEEAALAIWQAKPLLGELERRGVTESAVRKYKIGRKDGRITIPIYTGSLDDPTYVNLIRYLPGARDRKFLNSKGRGSDFRLYPIDQLKYDKLVLCGGMLKAVAASEVLNPHGVGAISSSGGEQAESWPEDIGEALSGKEWVGVCLDTDAAGVRAAEKLAAEIHPFVESVSVIELPLDKAAYPKGDVSDFLGRENGDLYALVEDATPWNPAVLSGKNIQGQEPQEVSIAEAGLAQYANERIKFKGLVSGIEEEAYYVPKTVTAECSKKSKNCAICPLYTQAKGSRQTLYPEHEGLLAIIHAPNKHIREGVRAALGVPACKSVRFEVVEHYHVRHGVITKDLDNTTTDAATIYGAIVDCDVDINETYSFTGRVVPHPKTQRATALISKAETVQDTLSQYTLDDADLTVFQCEWTEQGVARKFDDIHAELEANVTHIYERRDLHALLDLAWHSVLLFKVAGRTIKGWAEVCIVGDSSQGKTETSLNLMQHYGSGTKVDCKNATVAGLLGGVQQINNRHFVSWGIIPMHDMRLVVLEELKGANPEVVSKLTEMRSSGIAEIPKIEHKKAHARTRLVALSNPRSSNDVASYAYGTQVISELIPNLEDVRRFDAFMVMSRKEVDIGLAANSYAHAEPDAELTYTSELCNKLILWGWTRKPGEVRFESWSHVETRARDLCRMFTDDIPIVDRGSMRLKLARLSIAAAVRTFSHVDKDTDKVLVRKCHVDYVVTLLVRIYTSKFFGYDRLTKAVQQQAELKRPNLIESAILKSPFPRDFVECLLRAVTVEPRDFQDWAGMDTQDARESIGVMVRCNALVRHGQGYRKTSDFVDLLRRLDEGDKLDKARPDHIPETM